MSDTPLWLPRLERKDHLRIGLIADTHIPESRPDIPPEVFKAFAGVDLILHAGDLHVIRVIDELERIAPILCARGNGDSPEPIMLSAHRPGVPDDPRIKDAHVLELLGHSIGMTHDFIEPHEAKWTQWPTVGAMMQRDFKRRVDIIVCGDTHVEKVVTHDGALMVNPGSPTFPRNLTRQLGTVAILELASGHKAAQIIQLRNV